MVDRDGWHLRENGKYTVKSGYQVEQVYPDKDAPPVMYGPSVDMLKAYCWKVRCPPKLKHFYGNWCQDVYQLGKIRAQGGYKGTYVVPVVELQKSR